MPALGHNFDASRVAPLDGSGVVWEGIVPVNITSSEIKETNANDGQKMLVLHVTAAMGPYQGQTNLIRLNLYNRNPKAVEIAGRELSSICHVTNRLNVQASEQLHNAPFLTVWARDDRTVTDQATGAQKTYEGCKVIEYRYPDGRTIKEAVAGQPPSQPFNPAMLGGQGGPSAPAPQQQSQAQPQGFQPPMQPQAGAPSPTAPGAAFGGAPAPGGPSPASMPGGFGTAASPSNGPAPGQGPGPGGFGAPAGGPAQGPGFQPPAQPQGAPGGGFGGAPATGNGGGFAPAGNPAGPWQQG